MRKVAVLLAPGFEGVEAIVTIGILRCLQIKVETAAYAESRAVMNYHDMSMVMDSMLAARQADPYNAIVSPGESQGSINLAASGAAIRFIARYDEAGKLTCPVCSTVARVLDGNDLLKGRRYVCSGDLWQSVVDGKCINTPVTEDGNLTSGKGLGHIFDFALTLSARLLEDDTPVRDHADHVYYR